MIQIHLNRGWREDTETWANVDLTLRWKESKVRCRLFDCPGHRLLKETSTSSSACAFCWKQRRLLKLWFSAAPRSTCFASTSVFQVAAAACLVWSVGAKTAQHFFSTFRAIQDPKYTSLVPSMFVCFAAYCGQLGRGHCGQALGLRNPDGWTTDLQDQNPGIPRRWRICTSSRRSIHEIVSPVPDQWESLGRGGQQSGSFDRCTGLGGVPLRQHDAAKLSRCWPSRSSCLNHFVYLLSVYNQSNCSSQCIFVGSWSPKHVQLLRWTCLKWLACLCSGSSTWSLKTSEMKSAKRLAAIGNHTRSLRASGCQSFALQSAVLA